MDPFYLKAASWWHLMGCSGPEAIGAGHDPLPGTVFSHSTLAALALAGRVMVS
jgi:hypothetical protein